MSTRCAASKHKERYNSSMPRCLTLFRAREALFLFLALVLFLKPSFYKVDAVRLGSWWSDAESFSRHATAVTADKLSSLEVAAIAKKLNKSPADLNNAIILQIPGK